MSKAYKCDRCGTLFNHVSIYGATVEGSITRKFKDHWYPNHLDFCKDCGKSLEKILKKWFRDREDVN